MARYENILETIGRTPVVRLSRMEPPHVRLFAKIESFNPMSSVKDRLALGVIEDAEQRGDLKPGQTVIEATSGNTGIALAMVCARKGYPLVVTMAENFSVERRKLMRFLGARVVLTPAALKGSGMLAKAVELAREHGWFLARQFENEANADMHSRTTAREILADFEGDALDHVVLGTGSGGTLKGVGRVLRAERPGTRIVVCEPDNSPVLASGIPQPLDDHGVVSASHPQFKPHPMQGWSPDFVPKLVRDAVGMRLVDQVLPVNGADAMRCSMELARKEGILVGITAGGTLAGALKLAAGAPKGSTILCILPDTGERYLSTPLFADVPVDMTDEERRISQSTPSARFDVAAVPAPAPAPEAPKCLDAEAAAFVAKTLADTQQPVVMFALEWCEFCWAVRRLFAHFGIPYRSIDLDSVEYQAGDRGLAIRAAVSARTGIRTIPQVFVAGELVGGATDVLRAWKTGVLQQRLAVARVPHAAGSDTDPASFLPGWIAK